MRIFGLSSFARCMDYLMKSEGFTVHRKYLPSSPEVQVIAYEELDPCDLLIAIGPSDLNKNRERIFYDALRRKFELKTYISPDVINRECLFGIHCVVFEGNNIQPFCEVGDNVVMWSANHIGHESRIGSHCFITSHVCIGGRVTIGERCFLGINCSVVPDVVIGDDCIIQAGAVVDRNVPAGSVWSREGLTKIPSSRIDLS
jgi:sugar O-acyltransferase (sialic acid O-acetyltransferase NeuD family)